MEGVRFLDNLLSSVFMEIGWWWNPDSPGGRLSGSVELG